MQRNNRIGFTCPNCGGHSLAEAWAGLWKKNELTDVDWSDDDPEDPCVEFEHGEESVEWDAAYLMGYVCSDCLHTVARTGYGLLKWLAAHGMLQDDDCAGPGAGEAQRPDGAREEGTANQTRR